MDKSDILGKAKRETNKRACMVDLTLNSPKQLFFKRRIFLCHIKSIFNKAIKENLKIF